MLLVLEAGVFARRAKAQDLVPIEKVKNLAVADLDLVNNHDPEVEKANFDLLDGFEVNLFATDPMIANPVHMTWAPDGKLYVACSWAYPQLKPGEKANDKIIVLEDTDDDGRADKSTVFADGLYLPTGLELANGGVFVAQSPHVLFLKDSDGDDVADVREIALTGFGIEDSHHTNSAWRRGPGGWIYFQEGLFLHTQVETPYGTVRNVNGGVYQFNPRTGELRIFANVSVGNPWGHVFDEWGQSFLVDNPRISFLTPSTGNGVQKLRPFVMTQTEKQCGGDLISGSHMPPEMQGQLMSGRFKSRTVIRYEFTEDRSGFNANVLPPLISSRHPNFRPVDVKIGPDGAVYIADWYNSIINHAGHDFRDPRRDHEHGRIWRITAKDRPLAEKPKLVGQSLPELLDQLKSSNTWTRHYARKVISEHDPSDAVAAIEKWVGALDASEPGYEHHLIEALWAFQNIGETSEATLQKSLQAKSGQARAAATRIIRYWYPELSNPVDLIQRTANDPFPRVRLESVLSAGFIPDGRALVAAMQVIDHPQDPFIDAALAQTIQALENTITPELQFADSKHADYAKRLAGVGVEIRLADLLKKGSGTSAEIELIRTQFMQKPDAASLNQVIRALKKPGNHLASEVSIAMLESLSSIGRRKQFNFSRKVAPISGLLGGNVPELVIPTLDTLAAWKIEAAVPRIIKLLNDASKSNEIRIAAAEALGEISSRDGLIALKEMASESNDARIRAIAVHGLAVKELEQAAQIAADILTIENGDVNMIGLVEAFINRPGGSDVLGKSLTNAPPHHAVSAAITGYFNRTGTMPLELANHFRLKLNPSLLVDLLNSNVEELAAEVTAHGDAERGERIYRRKVLACSSCHGIAQVGPSTGPDLAAVGAASTAAYIVDSVLRPNNTIAEHYETFVIGTLDGELLTGLITFQDDKEIVLYDPGKTESIKILRDDIDSIRQGASLMPAGLAENLADKQEFLDLACFLSKLGRPGRYMTTTKPVIRRWRVLSDARPASELTLESVTEDANWVPAYSMVRGELPAEEFSTERSAFVRGVINVQQAGKASLNVNSDVGLRVWLDKVELGGVTSVSFDLTKGSHELTILVDAKTRGAKDLRVELIDDLINRARYKIEGGQ